MASTPPILDTRVLSDLIAQLQAQATLDVPQWTPAAEGDAGAMLQRIFARLAEIAIERLNRAPEKNMLAFLDAMGVSLLPPAPAQVPLTFGLQKNAPPTVIPKGTQASSLPQGNAPALVFETAEDFTVIPAKLASAFTMDPVWDRYTDQTTPVAGNGTVGFTPFVGTERMPHVLYVGDDLLLNFTHPAKATLTFSWPNQAFSDVVRQFLLALGYQYSIGGQLQTAPGSAISVEFDGGRILLSLALSSAIDLTALQSPGLALQVQSRWLQAILLAPIGDSDLARAFRVAKTSLTVQSASSFQPDAAFNNNAPLDLTKDFCPFGQTPGVGSTFYIGSQDAFSKPNGNAQLHFTLKPVDPPNVIWEYWNGSQWTQLPDPSLFDGTNGFTQSGIVSLTVPANVPSGALTTGVAAWPYVYVRARLASGGYRGAPSVTSFDLLTSAKLAAATAAQASALTIDTSSLTEQAVVAQFAGSGQIIQVDNDLSIVSFVSGGTINLQLPLPNAHAAGAPVRVLLATPATTVGQGGIAKLAKTFLISYSVPNQCILLIDDYWNPEFVTVTNVGQGQDASGAVVPGTVQVTLAAACQNQHAAGIGLSTVAPVQTGAYSQDRWVNLEQEFYPFGTTPGASSYLSMYSYGGTAITAPTIKFVIDTAAFGVETAALRAARAAVTTAAVSTVASTTPASTASRAVVARAAASKVVTSTPEEAIATKSTALQQVTTMRVADMAAKGFKLSEIMLGNFFLNAPQVCINFSVTINQNPPPVELAWEYLNSNGWQPISVPDTDANKFLVDGANVIDLQPVTCELGTVNNQKNYWVRARITSGNYGTATTYVPADPNDPSKGYQVRPGSGNVHPPMLAGLSLSYSASRKPTALISRNGFVTTDQTSANENGFVPFVAVTDLAVRAGDPEPAFYLGFDAAFPQIPVTLYFEASPRLFSGSVRKEISVSPSTLAGPSSLQWQYFNGTAWSRLTVLDGTSNLSESGMIEFLSPLDWQALARFDGNQLYWIRALSQTNDPFDTQELLGAYLNTTIANQELTIASEILGSSNGRSGQSLGMSRSPVLPNQQLFVIEPEPPSGTEAAALQAEEGDNAVQQVVNTTSQQVETWVTWHEVANFLASEPYSRHYTLDHATGTVTFGDGQRGMIPPIGTHNIRASYRYGGGALGNVAAGAVAQIQSKVPGASTVSNPVAADGGADLEVIGQAKMRGPQTVRHRGRSVATADVEWLALEAAGTRVARAKCLPNVNRDLLFEPGWLTLLIVPRSTDAKPSPSSVLITEVEDYLLARSCVGISQTNRINVIGPGYIRVAIAAKVVPQDLEEATSVKQAVLSALNAYLHPLSGGPQGTGWEFGESLYSSQISSLLESVPGVDHLVSLELQANILQHRVAFEQAAVPSLTISANALVSTPDLKKAAQLADNFDTTIGQFSIKGFKEGDRITRVLDAKVVSAAGTSIQVTASDGNAFTTDAMGMPAGSVVMTFDGSMSTSLTKGLLPNQSVTTIEVESELGLLEAGDLLTLLYPFPIAVTSVNADVVNLTVSGVSTGNIVPVAPFSPDIDVAPGTGVTTADGTQTSTLATGLAAGTNSVAQLTVNDSSFAASLNPGDVVTLLLPSVTLGIEPYQTEQPLAAQGVLARLDNRIRLPLFADIGAGQFVSSIRLRDFASGDSLVLSSADSNPTIRIETVWPVIDEVVLDPNFLIYSGPHQIEMVEE